jgi:hypothetical protein
MPAGAELLLSERVLDKDEPRGPGGSSNLNMLLYFAGRETTRTEYELMLAEAGFVDIETVSLQRGRALLTARKKCRGEPNVIFTRQPPQDGVRRGGHTSSEPVATAGRQVHLTSQTLG